MLDSLLKPYLEGVLSKRCKLKVQFADFTVDIWKGECHVTNATLFHPPLKEDRRWVFEHMAFAESITLTFDPIKALYGFLTNDCKLLVLKQVTVRGIDLFVEGYEEQGKKTVLNLKLIGGEIPRFIRKRKPTQLELRAMEREEEKLRKLEVAAAAKGSREGSKSSPSAPSGAATAPASTLTVPLPCQVCLCMSALCVHYENMSTGHQ